MTQQRRTLLPSKLVTQHFFQNLRETVERDEEIINVSLIFFATVFLIFIRCNLRLHFSLHEYALQLRYIFSNCRQEELSLDRLYQMTLLHM